MASNHTEDSISRSSVTQSAPPQEIALDATATNSTSAPSDVPRVLHVVGAMNRAGAESMLMTLYRSLDKARLQFDFLEFRDDESDFAQEILDMGGRILKYPWSQKSNGFGRTVRSLASFMRAHGPYAAVHGHILFANGAVMAAARKAGVPARIAHSHNTSDVVNPGLTRRLYHAASRVAIRWGATALVACGDDAGRYLFGDRQLDKVVVIPNAVDTQRYCPVTPPERHRLRRELGLRQDGLVLVAVARLELVKNHEFLVELASELQARGVDVEMLFVGTGSLREHLEHEIDARGLGSSVRMLGLRTDVERVLQSADALLMPSHFEGLPVVLVESQAVGLPCLVSDRVTQEADLGLGLLRFLPIDSVVDWADVLPEGLPAPQSAADIAQAYDASGYSPEQTLSRLLPLYALAEG